ncbi:MAG: hypothetical protein KF862_02340 [Chitinophagaceae bacterium]|nr:hypothetical protein [Chitinophagaceae bacterium]
MQANRSAFITRLTALWALSESGLGGLMFAFKIPLTGIFLGGFAVIIITLIARYSSNKWQTIVRSTLLVILVKAAASPHSPPPAYMAVGFQGLAGACIYGFLGMNRFSAVLFALLAMLESALQKIIVMTLIYGKNIWVALDSFFAMIVKDFGIGENISFSIWIISAYLLLYAVWGIIVGFWSFRISKNVEQMAADVIEQYHHYNRTPNIALPKKKSNRYLKWLFVIITLSFTTLVFVMQGMADTALYTVLRTVAAIIILFVIINPLVKFLMNKWLSREKQQHQKGITEILHILHELKSYVQPAMGISKQNRKGLSVYKGFVSNLLILSLFHPGKNE